MYDANHWGSTNTRGDEQYIVPDFVFVFFFKQLFNPITPFRESGKRDVVYYENYTNYNNVRVTATKSAILKMPNKETTGKDYRF